MAGAAAAEVVEEDAEAEEEGGETAVDQQGQQTVAATESKIAVCLAIERTATAEEAEAEAWAAQEQEVVQTTTSTYITSCKASRADWRPEESSEAQTVLQGIPEPAAVPQVQGEEEAPGRHHWSTCFSRPTRIEARLLRSSVSRTKTGGYWARSTPSRPGAAAACARLLRRRPQVDISPGPFAIEHLFGNDAPGCLTDTHVVLH